jgi:SH3 domain (SH3b1 type)/NLPC_P60 stabilising domain, N term/SH3 domain of SH3b2 type
LQLVYIIFISIILNACSYSHKEFQVEKVEERVVKEEILDLKNIPQFPSFYSKGIDKKNVANQDFLQHYFRVWNLDKTSISLKDAMWSYETFRYGDTYGENLQLLSKAFFDEVLQNSNFSKYATLNKRALSLNLLNMRAFPTDKPLLRDPTKAGEGFPFDYMQNSTVAANKPLFVSHYSQDREWVFVESSFAFGWVKANEIVFIEKQYTDLWQKAEQVFLTKEGLPIYSEDGKFLFKSRIGMMLALIAEDEKSYTVLTVIDDENSQAIYLRSKILKEDAYKGVLPFNTENINKLILQLSKTNYGWGGMYGQRDCSSTLRDFYIPFGLWLPRNSFMQAQQGKKISLEGLGDKKKIELIKKFAVPFETLLYKQGHIVLYVGLFNDDIVVFQNVWGVKTFINGDEGRYVVGKSIFSTLELGKNLREYDENGSLLRNLQSLSFPAKEN